jgi:tRNA (guanine37-N1)-methyltransferase
VKFSLLTLFPSIPDEYFRSSIMAKAVERQLVEYQVVDFREYAEDRHRTCDDAPYGGGAGMVLKPEPLAKALDAIDAGSKRVIYPSPSGRLFDQQIAWELSQEEELIFICGRYEGVDQRIIDRYVDDELCIGDYVMSSGELAALVIVDSVYRLLDGVISGESLEEETFNDGLLEYPHYTRPAEFMGMTVPEVLLSGNHAEIEKWRNAKRIEKTRRYRPDLFSKRSEGA